MRALNLEPLERRDLFSISPNDASSFSEDAHEDLLSHGGGCDCPVCAGTVANTPELWAPFQVANSPKHSLTSLPQLSSLPGSQYTLFLDFNGSVTTGWSSQPVTTPVYDFDGDRNTFSTAELNAIFEIWSRVAEDYAPFNINVTTVDPGNLSNNQVAKVAIGGNYTDWFGSPAGGVAYVGGFYNAASNVGFVFSDALAGGFPRYVAEAASHEAGHLFGLWHQSTYNANGQKTTEYSSGNSQWAPIMGVGYSSAVTTWHVGPNNLGPNVMQDDMAILTSRLGWRPDEAGNSTTAAAQLQISGTTVGGIGVISNQTDFDYYKFSTGGGSVTLTANPTLKGANLDVVLELRRADGTLVTSANPTNTMAASMTASLAAGDYFLVVRGNGQYGYVGNYILSGTVPAVVNNNVVDNNVGNNNSNNGNNNVGNNNTNNNVNDGGQLVNNNNQSNQNNNPQTTGPGLKVTVGGQTVDDRGSVHYGTVKKGTKVAKTFVVTNDGDSPLVLTQLTKRAIPRGFTLVQGLKKTVLDPGESTTFVLQMKHKKGNYGGWVGISSNDADQRVLQFTVMGVVNKTGIVGGKSALVGNGDAALATGVTLAGVGIETEAASVFNPTMSDVAVDRAFDELGGETAVAVERNLRFDVADAGDADADEWATENELLDTLEEQFAALDEVFADALGSLV